MEMPVAREVAPQSIPALAAHTLACPLRPLRSTACLYLLVGVPVLSGVSLTTVALIAQSPASAVEDSGAILTTESSLVIVPLHVYKNRKSVDVKQTVRIDLLDIRKMRVQVPPERTILTKSRNNHNLSTAYGRNFT